MATAKTRLVLFTDQLYRPGGMVFGWVRKITNRYAREARAAAPVRSGALKASIRGGAPRNPFAKTVQGTISVGTDHWLYVVKGTHGPIMSDAAWASGGPKYMMVPYMRSNGKISLRPTPMPGHMMAVGRNPWPPVSPMGKVKGQAANNFLETAWRRTARDHRAIRGVPFPIKF